MRESKRAAVYGMHIIVREKLQSFYKALNKCSKYLRVFQVQCIQ